MRFLMVYMQNHNLKDEHRWKMFYIGVNVDRFDEQKGAGTFSYLEGLEQTLGFNELINWEFVTIIVRFEKLWTLLIYRVRDKQIFAINYFNLKKYQMLAKFLLDAILGLKNQVIKFIQSFEIDKAEDIVFSGNLVFIFFYNLVLEKDFSHILSITKEGIQQIKSQTESLKWLVLQTTENCMRNR